MNENIKQEDIVLCEMLVGLFLTSILGQIVIIFLPLERLAVSIGWWAGILVAAFMAVHLKWSTSRLLDYSEKEAVSSLQKYVIIRYGVAIVVLVLLSICKLGNPVSYILGILGLKIAAYSQPLIHHIHQKISRR